MQEDRTRPPAGLLPLLAAARLHERVVAGPLREAVRDLCERRRVELKLVPLSLCTDNAAMIASAARFADPIPYPDYLAYDAFATRHERPTGRKALV